MALPPKKKKKIFGRITLVILIPLSLLVLVICAGVAVYSYLSYNLPQLYSLDDYKPALVTEVYSR